MFPASSRMQRTLGLLALSSCLVVPMAAARSQSDVGLIVSLNGRPLIQKVPGKLSPAGLRDALGPGAKIILKSDDVVGFCHESAGRIFRIQGAGSVDVGDVGINTAPGGPRVSITGVCSPSPLSSETGGNLSRGFRPASSPK